MANSAVADTGAKIMKFSEFASAVVAQAHGGVADPRLKRESAATGIYEGAASAGGFLVPDDAAAEIWLRASSSGLLYPRAIRLPAPIGDTLAVPTVSEVNRAEGSRFGGFRLYWVDEGETADKSRPEMSMARLELKKLLGLIDATDEVLSDAGLLSAFLKRALADESAFVIDDVIVNGSGVGQPLGVLNSSALIKVAKESGQSSSVVQYVNLTKMAARLWGPSHRNAMWLMSNETFEVVAPITTPQDVPVVTFGEDGKKFILGMPVELCEFTPSQGNAGDILLMDPTQYIISSKDEDVVSSIHVQFDPDQSVFRFRVRVDGQPGWSSPVVPKNGANTQSPFVALVPAP